MEYVLIGALAARSAHPAIERGRTSPRADTLGRLPGTAGYDLQAELWPASPAWTHMLKEVARHDVAIPARAVAHAEG